MNTSSKKTSDSLEPILVNTDSGLPPIKEEKPKKIKKVLKITFECLLLAVFLFIIAFSSEIIFLYARYSPFYVNGDSMYPTINASSKRSSSDAPNDGTWGNFDFGIDEWYTVDFGFMDAKDGFLSGLSRFNIVVAKYEDDTDKSPMKIKRIVGMPNESLYFDAIGDLYVKQSGETEYSLVEQTFSLFHKESTNSQSVYAKGESNPFTLGDDEYFLCGDNRYGSYSSDSRRKGSVHSNHILGRAVYIVGQVKFTKDIALGKDNASFNWLSAKLPWDFQKL